MRGSRAGRGGPEGRGRGSGCRTAWCTQVRSGMETARRGAPYPHSTLAASCHRDAPRAPGRGLRASDQGRRLHAEGGDRDFASRWETASLQGVPRLGSWRGREVASRAPRRPPIRTEALLPPTTSVAKRIHVQGQHGGSPTRAHTLTFVHTFTLVCTPRGAHAHSWTLTLTGTQLIHSQTLVKQNETPQRLPLRWCGCSTAPFHAALSFLV